MPRYRLIREIETERLTLNQLLPEDAPLVFYGWASKDKATTFLAWPTHGLIEETMMFLSAARSAWRAGTAFVYGIRLRHTNRLIGSIGLHRHEDGTFEIGYVLSPLFWGQGYASEAVAGTLRVSEDAGINRLRAIVHPDNQASVAVLTKNGFREVNGDQRLCTFPNITPAAVPVRVFCRESASA